jgi:hypothetical protein
MSSNIYTPSVPLDLERYQLPASAAKLPAKRARLPRHHQGEEFMRGPIPLAWLCRACRLRGKALAVAMALWFKAGAQRNTPTVVLSGALLKRFGVTSRKAGYHGLAALERAGLVAVERHTGRCPVVTIQNVV